MKEVKRLKRIVAVRMTQRDISAMRLLAAKHNTRLCEEGLREAEQQLLSASQPALGVELTQKDLERMDVARIAAWEEIAAWQENKYNAEQAQESARSQVEAQHQALQMAERLGEEAERWQQRRYTAAERQLADEQASRGRGRF